MPLNLDFKIKMKIEFYKSALCPRCLLTSLQLKKIKENHPEIEIETIDVLTNRKQFKGSGAKIIPALKINEAILQGLFLSPEKVAEFIRINTGLFS